MLAPVSAAAESQQAAIVTFFIYCGHPIFKFGLLTILFGGKYWVWGHGDDPPFLRSMVTLPYRGSRNHV
jgi:hypothetical protein